MAGHPLPGILDVPSLNLFAGASGIGKTALMASVAAILARGDVLFGHPTVAPPAVGYIVADRPQASARQWFTLAGAGDLPMYSVVDDGGFDLKQLYGKTSGPGLLAYAIEQINLPTGATIIVDPIALFVGGNLLDYRTVAIACVEIQRYLIAHPYTVIGVCHTSKQKADTKDRYLRPQDRILGTAALLGYTSTQMYLLGPEEAGRKDRRCTFAWISHHHPFEEFLIDRPPARQGLFDLERAILVRADEAAGKLSPELEVLLDLFPDYPGVLSTAAIVRVVQDVDRRTVGRRLRELERLGYILQYRKGLWGKIPL